MLERRQIEILMYLLSGSKAIKGRELADKYHVTARTVRNDIQEINEYLNAYGAKISADKKAGYFLRKEDTLRIRSGKIIEKLSVGMDFELPQTSNERIVYLLYSMLFGSEYSSTDIEDLFYISPSAVYGDLKALEMLIQKKTFLSLCKNGKMHSIAGMESDCRSVISGIYTQRRNVMLEIKYSHFITGDESFWNVIDFLSGIIMEYAQECGFELIGDSVYSFAVDIALTYHRNKQGFAIEPQDEPMNEYGMKLKQMLCMRDMVFNSLTDDDYIYLQKRLMAKEFLNHPILCISPETEQCFNEYQEMLGKYGILLDRKEEIMLEMERIVYRQRQHYYFDVHRKHEIFDRNPDCYYLAQILKYCMEKTFKDIRLTKSDTAVLTAAMKNTVISPVHTAVIVSDASTWTIEEIKKEISRAFADRIQITSVMSHYSFLRNQPLCDFVISTEPLAHSDIPVIETERSITKQTLDIIRQKIFVDRKETISSESLDRSVSFEAAITEKIRKLYAAREIGSLDFSYIEMNLHQSYICFPQDDVLNVTFPLISANHLKQYSFSVLEPFEYDGREYTKFNLFVFPINDIERINLHLQPVS